MKTKISTPWRTFLISVLLGASIPACAIHAETANVTAGAMNVREAPSIGVRIIGTLPFNAYSVC